MVKQYGLIGEKLGHSFSKSLHETIFKYCELNNSYELFEIEKNNLEKEFYEFKEKNISGINVTIPYKVDVMKYLTSISNEAKKIGAVNTLYFKNNEIIGYNTDYFGFKKALLYSNIDLKGKKVLILGTGGASKAILEVIKDEGATNITIASRNLDKKSGFEQYDFVEYKDIVKLKDYYAVINCTPVGMYPKISEMIIDKEVLKQFKIAIDLIYNPYETLFLKQGKQLGLKTLNGLPMLVYQGIKSEEIWNNIVVDKKIEDKILKDIILQFSR
ncbi:MAG: shikimate dehydrogenase [Clostridiaceae bacterium]